MAAETTTDETKPLAARFFWWSVTFPIRAAWRLSTLTCDRLGILATLIVGLALLAVGYFLTASLLGAIVGIPAFVAGLFLTARAAY